MNAQQPVTTVGETVSFELMFNPETDTVESIEAYTLFFRFDTAELQFTNGTYNLPNFINIDGPLVPDGDLVKFYAGGFGSPFTFPLNTATSVATLEFTVMDIQAFDGLADAQLLSQIGTSGPTQGFLDATFTSFQYDGALGADVGGASLPAMPVPAAVWLFGSGLLSVMAALMRKKHRSLKVQG